MRTTAKPSKRRRQLLLLSGLVLALLVTLFFGTRAFRRFRDRPTDEPIRTWMNIPYVAHSYHIPPDVLLQALNLPVEHPPNRRPISRIAQDLNLSTDEVIKRLEEAIVAERASRGPPEKPPPGAPPAEPTSIATPAN